MTAPDFMTDPAQLGSLEGQQYVVLRPAGDVSELYRRTQDEVLSLMPSGCAHPHVGHVTLRGFSECDRVPELRDAVRRWAAAQRVIDVAVDSVDVFPSPFNVAILKLARSASLVGAYSSLTAFLDTTDFRRIGELPLDEWVFHMSLAYGSELDPDAWAEAVRCLERLQIRRASVRVSELEFVWYEGGEHRSVFPLGSSATQRPGQKRRGAPDSMPFMPS